MHNQLTNISCLAGLFIIFLTAAYLDGNYLWFAGIVTLPVILIIRNTLGGLAEN